MPHRIISRAEFLQAYDDHADAVFRHCYLRVLDRERGKQAMTETFERMWLFLLAGNIVDSFRIQLYRTADAVIQDMQSRPAPEIASADIPQQLFTFLRDLPKEERSLCVLYYVDGFSPADIGAILGGSPASHERTLKTLRSSFSSFPTHVR